MELMDGNLMHLHASTGGAHGAYVYLFALVNLLLAPNLLDIYVCTWWRYLYIVGYICMHSMDICIYCWICIYIDADIYACIRSS